MIAERIEDFPAELICKWCPPEEAKKPQSEFYINKKNRRGSTKFEIKPICRRCKSKLSRRYRHRTGTFERLLARKAPLNAMVRMCEEHPEILAEIVRRYRPIYEPLLKEERDRIIIHMENVITANHNRRKYHYEDLEKEYKI